MTTTHEALHTTQPEQEISVEHIVPVVPEKVAYSLAGSRDIDRRTVKHRRELRDAGETPDRSFKNFPFEKERQELYEITRRTIDYIRDQDIQTVFCLDRSARMAGQALETYWQQQHADEPQPDVHFINPMGCISQQDVTRNGPQFREKLQVNNLIRQGSSENTDNLRSEQTIIEEFEQEFPDVDKSSPVLVFDTCLHSGDSVKPVIDKLEKAGFIDVRLGFCSTFENTSDIEPDFVALPDEPVRVCYPFGPGKSSGVAKTYDSIVSRTEADQHSAELLDQEIHRVIVTTETASI